MGLLAQFFGVLRAIIMASAGVLVGIGFAEGNGHVIPGLVLAAITLAWGIKQHAATDDQFMSLGRGIVAAFGGWAIHKGWATSNEVATWLGTVSTIGPIVWTAIVHYRPSIAEKAPRASPTNARWPWNKPTG